MRPNVNLEISVFSASKFGSTAVIKHPVCHTYLFLVIVLGSERKGDEFYLSIDTPLILLSLM